MYGIEEIYAKVRELLGEDDLSEEELLRFMRSETFQNVCPDFYKDFITQQKQRLRAEMDGPRAEIKKEKIKAPPPEPPKPKHSPPLLSNTKRLGKSSDSSSSSSSIFTPVPSKKKKTSPSPQPQPPQRSRKQSLCVRAIISDSSSGSSSSSSSVRVVEDKKPQQKSKSPSPPPKPPTPPPPKVKKEEDKPAPAPAPAKVHPFYLGQMGAIIQPKGKLFGNSEEKREKKRRRHEETHHRKKSHNKQHRRSRSRSHSPPPKLPKLPKPYTYYSSSRSKIGSGKHWKPKEEEEGSASRLKKSHNLTLSSVICLDLAKSGVFYDPSRSNPPKTYSVPLKRRMRLPSTICDVFERTERLKCESFGKVLDRLYKKRLAGAKIWSRKVGGGGGSSSYKNRADDKSKKPSTATAANSSSNHKNDTRKLAWEDKRYFDKKQQQQSCSSADKKKQQEQVSSKSTEKGGKGGGGGGGLGRIPKKPPAPNSITAILNKIEQAKKEAAAKPLVALKIPKYSDLPPEGGRGGSGGGWGSSSVTGHPSTSSEPAPEPTLKVKVLQLLNSESLVHCPIMPSNFSPPKLEEYTVKKMAWWYLKEEEDPPDHVLYHPESHDNEITEEDGWEGGEFEFGDDDSSVGCVSDPEGTCEPVETDYKLRFDPDKLDEYCGYSTVQLGKYRHKAKESDGTAAAAAAGKKDKKDQMKYFFVVRPDTNYEKDSFEAKCIICQEKVLGRRQLGAHIRSESHKNCFRNISLGMANYVEKVEKVTPTKCFTAKLVKYTMVDQIVPESPKEEVEAAEEEELKNDAPDSPLAVIEDKFPLPEVALENIPDDELSLPSLTGYDLEPDDEQLKAKICLRTNGMWTRDMEERWLRTQEKEAIITNEYNDMREKYIEAPETHPANDAEWSKFWERRSMEVEAEGKDPDSHDYGAEWIPFWFKRMQEIMKAEVLEKLTNMKVKYGVDAGTLKRICQHHGLSLESAELPNLPKHKVRDTEEPSPQLEPQPEPNPGDSDPHQHEKKRKQFDSR